MKKRMIEIMDKFHQYNSDNMAYLINNIVGIAEESGYELKKASVFCTPSISAEYYHLEEIKEFDTDLIERNSLASVTIWQPSNIGCFFVAYF